MYIRSIRLFLKVSAIIKGRPTIQSQERMALLTREEEKRSQVFLVRSGTV